MGFSKMLGLLQIKDKGHIILANAGNFYIARGKDALCLNSMIGLKLSCLETEICKVGFPINALEKYTNMIEKKDYSYIVYNYDNVFNELNVIKRYEGKNKNCFVDDRNNCYTCKNSVRIYRKEDKHLQAVLKLYNEEELEKRE